MTQIQNYCCLNCGDCCSAWKLALEQEQYCTLTQSEEIKLFLQNKGVDFQIIEGNYYLPKINDNCAFFVKEESTCFIHTTLGFASKPKVCKCFPFAITSDSHNNLYIDCSFFCQAIIQNKGQNIIELLQEDYIKETCRYYLNEQVLFKESLYADFQEILEITEILENKLETCCLNLPLDQWINPFLRVLKLLYRLRSPYIEGFKNNLNVTIGQKTSRIEYKINLVKQKLITAVTINKKNLLLDFPKLFIEGFKFNDKILGESINLKNLSLVSFSEEEKIKILLFRYLSQIISRKAIIAQGYSFCNIYMAMIIAYMLIIWYSKAFAQSLNEEKVSIFHIELAIRMVEKYKIGHNSKFLELILDPASNVGIKAILSI